MTVAQAKQRIYTLATGESDEPDSDTAALALLYINIFKDRWAKEPGTDWNSLRGLEDVGTITATDTFDISDVKKLSKQEGDYITILRTDGGVSTYTLVPAAKLYTTAVNDACAVVGTDLVFAKTFTATSPQIGGTLRVPLYNIPDDLVADTEDIPVDDPDWVCFMAAAEITAHDVTKTDHTARMIAYATDSMAGMKENNEAQADEIYNDYNPLGHLDTD